MPNLTPPAPTHLSIFVTDPETGRPVQRLPLYAEVAVPRIAPIPPINERFREPARAALINIDPQAVNDPAALHRVETAALQAFAETIDDTSQVQLLSQPERIRKLFEQAFKEVLESTGRATMAGFSTVELKPLIATALRKVAPRMELGVTA